MVDYIAKITVPLKVNRNKIKVRWWHLNMNNWISACRNSSFRNSLKQKYQREVIELVKDIDPIKQPVKALF